MPKLKRKEGWRFYSPRRTQIKEVYALEHDERIIIERSMAPEVRERLEK